MSAEFPGWLTPAEATERYGISYTMIRKLLAEEVLTRGQFSTASERPPIYLRVEELDAWKRGGVPAIAPVKARYEASLALPVVLGGES